MAEEIKSLDEILEIEKAYNLCYHLFLLLLNKVRKAGFDSLTHQQQTFFVAHQMDCQVQNGGFHSYFSNPTGEHANEILAALREVKANDEVEFMEKVLSVFPDGHIPTDDKKRGKILWALPEETQWEFLSQLSSDYYDFVYGLPFNEGLDELLAVYVRANKLAFE